MKNTLPDEYVVVSIAESGSRLYYTILKVYKRFKNSVHLVDSAGCIVSNVPLSGSPRVFNDGVLHKGTVRIETCQGYSHDVAFFIAKAFATKVKPTSCSFVSYNHFGFNEYLNHDVFN